MTLSQNTIIQYARRNGIAIANGQTPKYAVTALAEPHGHDFVNKALTTQNNALQRSLTRLTKQREQLGNNLIFDAPKPGTPEHDQIRSASKCATWCGYPYTAGDNPYIRQRGHAMEPVIIAELERSGITTLATQATYLLNNTLATIDLIGVIPENDYNPEKLTAIEIKTPTHPIKKVTDLPARHLFQLATQQYVTGHPVQIAIAETFTVELHDPSTHPAWMPAKRLAKQYVNGAQTPNPEDLTDFQQSLFRAQQPEAHQILQAGNNVEKMAAWQKAIEQFKKNAKAAGDGDVICESGKHVATISNGRFTWKQ